MYLESVFRSTRRVTGPQDSFYLSWRTPKSEVSMKIGVKYLERQGGVHQDTKGNRSWQ